MKLTDKQSIDGLLQEMTLHEKLLLLTGDSMFTTKGFEKYGIPKTTWLDGGTGFNTLQMTMEVALQTGLEVNNRTLNPEEMTNPMGPINDCMMYAGPLMQPMDPVTMTPETQHFMQKFGEKMATAAPNQDMIGCYPPGMLLGATWDPEAPYACGEALGREASAFNLDVLLGTPNVNLHRDPRNGRLFEGYSEDPYLVAALAPSFVKGIQESGIAANVKHYAANNSETDRMGIDEIISERAMQELYLPGFKACIKAGCKTIMSAYNKINGVQCAHNSWLLDDVLRKDWGFKGVVVSDWGAVFDRVEGLKNGNDLTMPGPREIAVLERAVESGEIPMEMIDKSARRMLELILELPAMKGKKHCEINTNHSFAAAYKAAVHGITLLKNDGILPLSKGKKISFYGERSRKITASGAGSAEVATNLTTNLFDEAVKILGAENVAFETVSADTDVIIVTVGANGQEGQDRLNMEMEPADEISLQKAIAEANGKPVIMLLNTAAPVEIADVERQMNAILCLYFPGMAGGKAAIDIIFGDAEPSGRLPLSWPRAYIDCPTALTFPGEQMRLNYGEELYVGYRYYDAKGIKPLYHFGHGLSYTTFRLSNLRAPANFNYENDDDVTVLVDVKNNGNRAGYEVIQLYVHDDTSTLRRPFKELKAFKKVFLQPGEEATVDLKLDKDSFAFYDAVLKRWVVEPGTFTLLVGESSETMLLNTSLNITGYNVYGLSEKTGVGAIAANPVAIEIISKNVPDFDLQMTLGMTIVFLPAMKFSESWSMFAPYFNSDEEMAVAYEKICADFAQANREGRC